MSEHSDAKPYFVRLVERIVLHWKASFISIIVFPRDERPYELLRFGEGDSPDLDFFTSQNLLSLPLVQGQEQFGELSPRETDLWYIIPLVFPGTLLRFVFLRKPLESPLDPLALRLDLEILQRLQDEIPDARKSPGSIGSAPLRILHQVSRLLQGTFDLEKILAVTLTGVTSGSGLGFNRGMIFLMDPSHTSLELAMGIGPTHEIVNDVWRAASARFQGLEDYLDNLDVAAVKAAPFYRMVKDIKFSVEERMMIPFSTVVDRVPEYVSEPWNAHDRIAPALRSIMTSEFVSIPIFTETLAVGALVVDNYFNRKSISQDEIRLLQTFANQLGLAIQSSRLFASLSQTLERFQDTYRRQVEMEKMAAIGEITAEIVHDIRNPLTVISGFLYRLEKKSLTPEDRTRYMEILKKEVHRLENLAHQVLAFSRKDKVENFETTDLNVLLKDLCELTLKRWKEYSVMIAFHLSDRPLWVSCDPFGMEQVLRNLIQNAAEAMTSGGEIMIETQCCGDEVFLRVYDQGEGIPQENINQIFRPFFTNKKQGSGFGLSICRRIIRSHGGEITVKNRQDMRGCVFEVKLPMAQKDGN